MIELFTRPGCGYCVRAAALLRSHALEFVEYDISTDPRAGAEMRRRVPSARTVPQIFISGVPIGGYDDLVTLVRSDGLAGYAVGCRRSPDVSTRPLRA